MFRHDISLILHLSRPIEMQEIHLAAHVRDILEKRRDSGQL